MSEHSLADALIRRGLLGMSLFFLLVLGYRVLQLFIVPVVWAVILVYLSWPVYRRLRWWVRRSATTSALLMTLLLGTVFTLPLLWVLTLLRTELPAVYRALTQAYTAGPLALPESIVRIPVLGPELQHLLNQFWGEHSNGYGQLVQWVQSWGDEIATVLGTVGLNMFKFGCALLTAFFFYRDGERIFAQTRQILLQLLGERTKAYLAVVGDTIRAVLYGVVLTALVQGLLAGFGYWAVGLPAPVLLGTLTAGIALIPFGLPFVWWLLGGWLLLVDRTLAGIGLFLWGALVVGQIDNLIRPFVISSTTRIPFLLVLFGVLGGIQAFGLVGLFLGPAVIAILLAVWREWLEEHAAAGPPE